MKTAICIINWNNASDTIDCLKSVLNLPDTVICVWDNASTDQSIDKIIEFATNEKLVFQKTEVDSKENMIEFLPLNIFKSSHNLGFAKANNELFKMAKSNPAITYFWLINNDAIAAPKALEALITTIESHPKTLFAGSVILDEKNKNLIQCCGVDYFKYFGVGKLLLKNKVWNDFQKNKARNLKPVFQNGASLLIKKEAIDLIGYMDENFFLYAEEHDWQKRADDSGYKNQLALESIVYHKGSISTLNQKHLFYYYYTFSSVYFSRKHYSFLTAFIASNLLIAVTLIRTRFNFNNMKWAFKGLQKAWKINL